MTAAPFPVKDTRSVNTTRTRKIQGFSDRYARARGVRFGCVTMAARSFRHTYARAWEGV